MKLPDGREAVCALSLPLPLSVASAVMTAVCDAVEELGYTDVSFMTDGTERIVAKPPERDS